MGQGWVGARRDAEALGPHWKCSQALPHGFLCTGHSPGPSMPCLNPMITPQLLTSFPHLNLLGFLL